MQVGAAIVMLKVGDSVDVIDCDSFGLDLLSVKSINVIVLMSVIVS